MLGVGLILSALGASISLFLYFKQKSEFHRANLLRLAVWGGLGVIIAMISDHTLIDIYFADESEEYRELFKMVQDNPNDEELRKQLMETKTEY